MSPRIVIVGAGECGTRAALALRELGHDGAIVLVGGERHAPYERPPMSKELMIAARDMQPRTIATKERLAAAAIDFRPATTVTAISPADHCVLLADGRLPYDRLLLATGAEPRRLTTANGSPVAYLRTHDDALRIKAGIDRRDPLVVIGGGFIGLELAAAARSAGAEVAIVEALPRLLSRGVPEELALALTGRHRAEGVAVHLRATVAGIEPGAVTLGDGNHIPAGLVVAGIGALPATGLAAAAGLTIDNGIAVDDRLRTSAQDIFAAGDCCSFPLPLYGGRRVRLESWRNAQDQGNLAARNLLGADEAISAVPWFWSDQYDQLLQIAGLPDEGRVTVPRAIDNGRVLFHLDDTGRLVAASGLGAGNAVARDIRIAEMLIARRARPAPETLADPGARLKALLAA